MAEGRPRRLGPLVRVAAGLIVAGSVVACGSSSGATSLVGEAGDPSPASPSTPSSAVAGVAAARPGVDGDEVTGQAAPGVGLPVGVEPRRIEIPDIGVDTTVIDLDVRGEEPEVPDDFAEVGWYEQSRRPGEIGPAVLAGHIDSRSGPAVFHRLDELRTGSLIVVTDEAGASRTFEVTGTGQYPKDGLPAEVFGFGDGSPELRLITCGGAFDRSVGHYEDNYVVYARAVQA